MNLDDISKSEIIEWINHPCTINLKQELVSQKETIVDTWISGGYTHSTSEGTALKNAQALSYVQILDEVLNYIEDFRHNEESH